MGTTISKASLEVIVGGGELRESWGSMGSVGRRKPSSWRERAILIEGALES